MNGLPLFQVDAFADGPFTGNPAAVCLLDDVRDDAWLQAVAMEMNLSETAFVHPEGDGWRLRWFTPTAEVDLCGHATLATAHVLWQERLLAPGADARFHTRSGTLGARRLEDGWIELDFPATPPAPAEAPDGLAEALGVEPLGVLRSRFDYVVDVESAETVRGVAPDFGRLRGVQARGVIVTAPGTDGVDFVSRFFAPAVGVDEDPVTGSAHCALTPLWAARLGRDRLLARQLSRRGGTLRLALLGDRVRLAGAALTVLRGTLSA